MKLKYFLLFPYFLLLTLFQHGLAQELAIIPGPSNFFNKGIYLYTKDGGLYVQNRRGSPIPAIILVAKFETREAWEDTTSLFNYDMGNIPGATTFLMISNGSTLFSEIMLEADNETLLIPPEDMPGYYKIAAAWGNYSDAQPLGTIPLTLNWLDYIHSHAIARSWSVETTLMTASTYMATASAITTAYSNIKYKAIGDSVSILQDIANNHDDLWSIIERYDNGSHGGFIIFEHVDNFMSDIFGNTFSSTNISKARMASEWLGPIGPLKLAFYFGTLSANSLVDGVVVASDLLLNRDQIAEVTIYLDSQGNIGSDAIIPSMNRSLTLENGKIRLMLSADESFIEPNVTGLQYTWLIDLIPNSGSSQHLSFFGSNISTLVSGNQDALVTLSVSGYKNGIFFHPRPIKTNIRLPVTAQFFDSNITSHQLGGGRVVNVNLNLTDIDESDLTELNIDYGDGVQELYLASAGAIPLNFTHEYSSDGDYEIKVSFLVSDGGLGLASTTATISHDDNRCPIAAVSSNQTNVSTEVTVTINGAGSSDPDGNPLSYSWYLEKPSGSNRTLVGTGSSVTLTPDVGGGYTVKLRVSDQSCISNEVSIAITADASQTYWDPEAWTITNITTPDPEQEQESLCGKVIQLGHHTVEPNNYFDHPRLWATTFAHPDGGRADLYLMIGLNEPPSAEPEAGIYCNAYGFAGENHFDNNFSMNMADGTLTNGGKLTHVKTWNRIINPGDTLYFAVGLPDDYQYDIEQLSLQTNRRIQPPIPASCGLAANTLTSTAPTINRCAAGSSATNVSTYSDHFAWACISSTGGASANCQAPRGYTVTPITGANGSANPSTPQLVSYNNLQSFDIIPFGYYKASISGCGINQSNIYQATTVTTSAIIADCSVNVEFTEIPPAVCGTAAGVLTTNPPASSLCATGSTAISVASVSSKYAWECESDLGGQSASCEAPRAYNVTPSIGSNGSMTPSSPIDIQYGERQEFTVMPDDGYVAHVTGCNGNLSSNLFTTGFIFDNCTVTASFFPINNLPTLTITTPPGNVTLPNSQSSYAFSGTADDTDGTIDLVQYRIDNGSWQNASGTDNWSFTVTGLIVGDNTIEVRARDDNRAYSDISSRTITRQAASNTAPTLTITTPLGNDTIPNSQSSYAFSGTASDTDGTVDLIQYRIDNGNWQNASGTSNWSFTATGLTVGTNTVEVRAQDDDGDHSSISSRTITRQAANNNPPTLTITAPAGNVSIPNAQSSHAFNGTASDSDGSVNLVQYRVNSGSWQNASGTGSWSFTATGLMVGANTVEVRAQDDDEAYSSISNRTITRQAANNNPPTLTITAPAGNVSIPNAQSSHAFNGTASDSDGSVNLVQYRVNSGNWQNASGTNNWSFTATALVVGANTVEVRAQDDDGDYSSISNRTITREASTTNIILKDDFEVSNNLVSICNQNLDFNGGTLPQNWRVVKTVNNGLLANDRLETQPTNSLIQIGADTNWPATTSEIIIRFTAHHPYTEWGNANWVLLKTAADGPDEWTRYVIVQSAQRNYGLNQIYAGVKTPSQNPADSFRAPFEYGEQDVELRIRADSMNILIKRKSDAAVVMDKSFAVETSLADITSIVFSQNTTTDNTGWSDDLSFVCQDDSLVAHYPFNGNTQDATGNNGDGDVSDAVLTQDRSGNPDKAYSFDGVNDYISVPYAELDSSVTGLTEITVSAWIKLSQNIGNTQARIVNRQTGNGPEAWGLEIFGANYSSSGSGNNLNLHANNGGQGNGTIGGNTVSPTNLAADTWYHVAGIVDASTRRLYIDGQLDVSIDNSIFVSTAETSALVLGRTASGNSFYFPGAIDDIRIYNRGLSDAEIQSLYNLGPD